MLDLGHQVKLTMSGTVRERKILNLNSNDRRIEIRGIEGRT